MLTEANFESMFLWDSSAFTCLGADLESTDFECTCFARGLVACEGCTANAETCAGGAAEETFFLQAGVVAEFHFGF